MVAVFVRDSGKVAVLAYVSIHLSVAEIVHAGLSITKSRAMVPPRRLASGEMWARTGMSSQIRRSGPPIFPTPVHMSSSPASLHAPRSQTRRDRPRALRRAMSTCAAVTATAWSSNIPTPNSDRCNPCINDPKGTGPRAQHVMIGAAPFPFHAPALAESMLLIAKLTGYGRIHALVVQVLWRPNRPAARWSETQITLLMNHHNAHIRATFRTVPSHSP